MGKFIATRKCFHGSHLYRIGAFAKFTKASDGPKDKDGKLIHFKKIDEGGGPKPRRSKPNAAKPVVKVNDQEV